MKAKGRAEKRARNLSLYAKELEDKDEGFLDTIIDMDDDGSYQINKDGKPYLYGIRLKGKQWKDLIFNYRGI
jgi:hypothetical protein